ncbi:hypothetical protein JR316_0004038 [Psilocybe cubensis]|uniref:Uncharacterized protein n=1 Tax=Psilocybe cubensis TaxID=181762 RepID=A0ACB8HAP5_PSICU|nr:hypothetical protein JR316_0004038 [Psilocybe cubensis]KAH9484556.1 hypothetical protein JR316_0004038 [Psilocybe cubensis]
MHPPLDPSEVVVNPAHFPSDTALCSEGTTVSVVSTSPLILDFTVTARESGILVLPEGASREDLASTTRIKEYVRQNALQWYQYLNAESTATPFPNGSLYVITGHDKARRWAVCTSGPRRHRLKEHPAEIQYNDHRWTFHKHRFANNYSNSAVHNGRCAMFLRGIRFAVCAQDWTRHVLFDKPPAAISFYYILTVRNTGFWAKLVGLIERSSWSRESFAVTDVQEVWSLFFHALWAINDNVTASLPPAGTISSDPASRKMATFVPRPHSAEESSPNERMALSRPLQSVIERFQAWYRQRTLMRRVSKVFPGPSVPRSAAMAWAPRQVPQFSEDIWFEIAKQCDRQTLLVLCSPHVNRYVRKGALPQLFYKVELAVHRLFPQQDHILNFRGYAYKSLIIARINKARRRLIDFSKSHLAPLVRVWHFDGYVNDGETMNATLVAQRVYDRVALRVFWATISRYTGLTKLLITATTLDDRGVTAINTLYNLRSLHFELVVVDSNLLLGTPQHRLTSLGYLINEVHPNIIEGFSAKLTSLSLRTREASYREIFAVLESCAMLKYLYTKITWERQVGFERPPENLAPTACPLLSEYHGRPFYAPAIIPGRPLRSITITHFPYMHEDTTEADVKTWFDFIGAGTATVETFRIEHWPPARIKQLCSLICRHFPEVKTLTINVLPYRYDYHTYQEQIINKKRFYYLAIVKDIATGVYEIPRTVEHFKLVVVTSYRKHPTIGSLAEAAQDFFTSDRFVNLKSLRLGSDYETLIWTKSDTGTWATRTSIYEYKKWGEEEILVDDDGEYTLQSSQYSSREGEEDGEGDTSSEDLELEEICQCNHQQDDDEAEEQQDSEESQDPGDSEEDAEQFDNEYQDDEQSEQQENNGEGVQGGNDEHVNAEVVEEADPVPKPEEHPELYSLEDEFPSDEELEY